MNILFLSESDPRNMDFGGAQRTHFIWKALQQRGDVYSVFFDQQFKTEEIAPKIWHVKKLLKVNALQYFFYRLERKILEPFRVLPLWPIPTRLEKNINDLFPNIQFDMIVCRYCFDLMEMHLWNFPKVYVDFDDHPLEMYDTLKSLQVHRILRPIGRWLINRQMDFLQRKITGGWISNPNQVKLIHCKDGVHVLKNIAVSPSSQYEFNARRKQFLMIVGAMSYYPNYSGVDWFLKNIWCKIQTLYPNLQLFVVGRGLASEYLDKWTDKYGVKCLGFVENLEKLYQECLATIVPVYSGGGTCIKTIEAMSFGRVCVSSPFGARGLEEYAKQSNSGLQVFNSVEDFLRVLEDVVLDTNARSVHEKSARNYVLANYSQESFNNSILSVI